MEILKFGSTGPRVAFLQLALSRANFSAGALDGIFGNQTYHAVQRFQSANGLAADGIVGPLTQAALKPYQTGYRKHTIRSGDTFYKLANAYGTTLRSIEIANPNVDPLNLRIGSTITIPLSFPVVPTTIPFTSEVLDDVLIGLQSRYPFIHTESAGKSVLGKPIYYTSIGKGDTEVFYNASHHANEWITTPLLLKYLEDYAHSYAFGDSICNASSRQLYENTTLYLMPLVNPDGVDLVTGLFDKNSKEYTSALSMNTPPLSFPQDWKANISGVDLNLQYPAGWEIARELKYAAGFTKPGPRDFVGTAPLSEPESRSVYYFTLEHNFSLTLSYHTQGQVIYWKYLDCIPENSLSIGHQLAAASGYVLELTPSFSGYAGYKDWFILNYNRPGYTVEAGSGKNPLPISQFDDIYRDNLCLMTLGMQLLISE